MIRIHMIVLTNLRSKCSRACDPVGCAAPSAHLVYAHPEAFLFNFGGGLLPLISLLEPPSLLVRLPFFAVSNCFTIPLTWLSFRGPALPTLLALPTPLPARLDGLETFPAGVVVCFGVEGFLAVLAARPALADLTGAALRGVVLGCMPLMLRFLSRSRILRAALSVTTLLGVVAPIFSRFEIL